MNDNRIYKIFIGWSILILVFGFGLGYAFQASRIDQIKQDYAEQVNKALQENRELEKRLQDEADSITQKYQKEAKDAQKTIENLRSRIADGSLRLSVRTASTKGMSDSTSTEHREERAELDGATAQSLVSIVSDGDGAIRDLNQCIDRYNAIRTK